MQTRLAAVMREKGVKPSKLARELELSHSYINRLMRGERQPSLRVAKAIAAALDANFADLFLAPNETQSHTKSQAV